MKFLEGMPIIVAAVCLAPNAQALPPGKAELPGDPIGRLLDQAFVDTGEGPPTREAGKFVVFRRNFDLKESPGTARLDLFANSRYMLWVNGTYIARGPCRFERAAPEYDTINLTGKLLRGRNSIAVLVTGPLSNGKIQWAPLALTARLSAERFELLSDKTWKWSDHTRYRSANADWPNVYDVADARVDEGDWTASDFDDSQWRNAEGIGRPTTSLQVEANVDGSNRHLTVTPIRGLSGENSWFGSLTARRTPLLRETIVKPKWDKEFPLICSAGEQIGFKFPRLLLAYTRIEVEAEEGSELEFTYSPQTRYICRAGTQEFVTSDSIAICEGAVRVRSGKVTFKRIDFVERLYPFIRMGSFHSDDPLLDKLWTTCVRALEITSEDSYIDCADRERVEWMDVDPPMFDVTRTAVAGPPVEGRPAFADPRLLESMVRRTAYSLQPEGWVKAHTCSDRFDIHAKMEDRSCNWIEGARRYYESTGKTRLIKEIWPSVVAQLNYFLVRRSERGLVFGRDWGVWGNPIAYQHCEATILNAFVYKALEDAAFLGLKIGKVSEAGEFRKQAAKLRSAINDVLWDETAGTYFAGYYDKAKALEADPTRPLTLPVSGNKIVPTMNAALFALDQGVVPENRRPRVESFLFANPPHDNYIMQYYYFFKQSYVADTEEKDEYVVDSIRQEWEDMANSKYEATFEGLHSEGSSAHSYGMFPAYFLSAYVLGVRVDGEARHRNILIEPRLARLNQASGTVVTEMGLVHVKWKRDGDSWSFDLQCPVGTKLRLRLPTGRQGFVRFASSVNPTNRRDGRWTEYLLQGGHYSGKWTEE